MKNKAYFINRLAQLKGLDPSSPEVQAWNDMKIVDLLVQIREEREKKRMPVDSDSDDDISIMRRVLKT
ncbi:hypothetical protein EBT31_02785 [bacterium]|nr:hypothetical protein [bacterium]